MATFAIVQTGGKQYRVQQGDTIRVESLQHYAGDTVELDNVLMVSRDGVVIFGAPTVSGAKVTTEVVGQGKGKKVTVFKYKPKPRYRRKMGHRQPYTDLHITDITLEEVATG